MRGSWKKLLAGVLTAAMTMSVPMSVMAAEQEYNPFADNDAGSEQESTEGDCQILPEDASTVDSETILYEANASGFHLYGDQGGEIEIPTPGAKATVVMIGHGSCVNCQIMAESLNDLKQAYPSISAYFADENRNDQSFVSIRDANPNITFIPYVNGIYYTFRDYSTSTTTPLTLVFDESGNIVYRYNGADTSGMCTAILSLLGKTLPSGFPDIEESQVKIELGENYQLTLNGASWNDLIWKSATENGVVDMEAIKIGKVKGLKTGTERLWYGYIGSGSYKSLYVTVTEASTVRPSQSLTLSPTNVSLKVGESQKINVNWIDTTQDCGWRYSGDITSIDYNQLINYDTVVARKAGKVTLTASNAGKSATVTVTITEESAKTPEPRRPSPSQMFPPAENIIAYRFTGQWQTTSPAA